MGNLPECSGCKWGNSVVCAKCPHAIETYMDHIPTYQLANAIWNHLNAASAMLGNENKQALRVITDAKNIADVIVKRG